VKRTVIAVLVAISALALAAPAAQASVRAPLNIVALGDSYGSGTGAGDYQEGTENGCWRSDNSYSEVTVAALRASGRKVTFTNVTCSGADTADLRQPFKGQPPQLDALTRSTNIVLLTIGTNDVDYAGYGGFCIQADCTGAPTADILGRLPAMGANVSALIGDIKARSPHAKVALVAYGRQLSIADNAPGVPLDPICAPEVFTSQERVQGNSVASALDRTLREAARSAKATFVSPYTNSVDVRPGFAGHSLCEGGTPFYRGFDALAPGQEGAEAVLHLNAAGQAAMARLVRQRVFELC
jgi:lysophospholipase L1-like esterase